MYALRFVILGYLPGHLRSVYSVNVDGKLASDPKIEIPGEGSVGSDQNIHKAGFSGESQENRGNKSCSAATTILNIGWYIVVTYTCSWLFKRGVTTWSFVRLC